MTTATDKQLTTLDNLIDSIPSYAEDADVLAEIGFPTDAGEVRGKCKLAARRLTANGVTNLINRNPATLPGLIKAIRSAAAVK